MISALLPHATAHLSSHSPLFPLCVCPPSSLRPYLSQVAAGTSRNRGRLSWSFSLTPGWNGRCEVLNISLFRSDEGTIFNWGGGNKFHEDSLIRGLSKQITISSTHFVCDRVRKTHWWIQNIPLGLFQPVNLIIRLMCHFISLDHSLEILFELLKAIQMCGARLSSCFQFHYRVYECQFSW